jgi:hypothetical protein
MKMLSVLVLTTTIASVGVSAAPALAAANGTLACNTGTSEQQMNNAKNQLSQELQLSTKQAPSVDEWNGCLKVQFTDANGHTNVALYDPDSLTLVNQLS